MDKSEYKNLLKQKDEECKKQIELMKAEVLAKEKRMKQIIGATYPMNVSASCYADAVAKVFDGSIKYLQSKHPHAKKAIEEVKEMEGIGEEKC